MPDTTSFSGSTGTASSSTGTAAPAPSSVVTDWFNVRLYGAKGDAVTDDTAAVQAAIDACDKAKGGVVFFPAGNYNFKGLTVRSHQTWIGENAYRSTLEYSGPSSVSAVHGVDVEHWTVRDLGINGPWATLPTGTGHGIDLTRSTVPDTHYLEFTNVHVQNFGGSGIRVSNPIVSTLTRCVATNCGTGFDLYGVAGGAAGTSTSLRACYALACTAKGYHLTKMAYSIVEACACDKTAVGWHIENCDGVAVTACGGDTMGTTGILVDNTRGLDLRSFFTWNQGGVAIYVTNSSQGVNVSACVENGPAASAQASIKVDSGCSVAASGNTGVSNEMRVNK